MPCNRREFTFCKLDMQSATVRRCVRIFEDIALCVSDNRIAPRQNRMGIERHQAAACVGELMLGAGELALKRMVLALSERFQLGGWLGARRRGTV